MAIAFDKSNSTSNAKLLEYARRLSMEEDRTIRDIECELGLANIKPIAAAPSDEKDMTEKDDIYREWYEEELLKLYYGRK